MGGRVSNFPDHQALVDSLTESCRITPDVERVFRLVDRGFYAIEPKGQIYSDSAWRIDKLHLSAPGIYITVLRELDIQPGQSVLNIGSGTGYLSTMFGLLLGSNGVNHGIELHESNVAFARERLAKFLTATDAVFERDFCEPCFIIGNIFTVVPPATSSAQFGNEGPPESSGDFDSEGSSLDDFIQQSILSSNISVEPPPLVKREYEGTGESELEFWPTYDRIYVGSMISSKAQLEAILRLLNIGGRLIAPIYDQLHKIDRVSTNKVNDTVLNNVSFVSLVSPSEDDPIVRPPPRRKVDRLERLACRRWRQQLRQVILQRVGVLPTLARFVRARRSSTSQEYVDENSAEVIPSSDSTGSSSSSTSISSSWMPSPRPSAPSTPPERLQEVSERPSSSLPINVTVTPVNFDSGTAEADNGRRTVVGQLDFLEMLSRNILYCQMQARSSHSNREPDAEMIREGDEEHVPNDGRAESVDTDTDNESDDSPLYDVCAVTQHQRKRKRRRREDGVEAEDEEKGDEEEGGDEDEESEEGTENRGDEGRRGQRRRRARRGKGLTWRPQSYTFRERMQQFMEEELLLPPYTVDLVLRVI